MYLYPAAVGVLQCLKLFSVKASEQGQGEWCWVVQLRADEYGNGVVGAYDRKSKGRTLKPGN